MDLQLLVFENIEKACTESSDTSVLQKNLSETDLNATCLIIYTTGTTGTPNGVMLSCENVLANIDAVSRGVEIYTKAERVMLLLPLHHIFPLLGSMVAPLYVGATVAICPALQSKDIINSLQENRITILIGVPRLYKMISKGIMTKINQKAAARLLYGFSEKMGSQSLSRKLFASVHKKFGGGYQLGLTGIHSKTCGSIIKRKEHYDLSERYQQ